MPFETSVVAAAPAGHETPLLALALTRGPLPASLAALDKQTGGAIGRVLSSGDFTGKRDETAVLYPSGPASRLLLIGLGKTEEVDRGAIRRAAAVAAKRARSLGVPRAAFHLPGEASGTVSLRDAGQAIAEGSAQGAWQYNEMKKPEEKKAASRAY